MRKINFAEKEAPKRLRKNSFVRCIQQLFSRLIEYQNCNCSEKIEEIYGELRRIADLIEIIAREVNRLSKDSKPIENDD